MSRVDLQHPVTLADPGDVEHAHDQGGQCAGRGGTAGDRSGRVGGGDAVDLGDPGGVLVDKPQPLSGIGPVAPYGDPLAAVELEQGVARKSLRGTVSRAVRHAGSFTGTAAASWQRRCAGSVMRGLHAEGGRRWRA